MKASRFHSRGQGLPEYATILALVTLFCVGALYFFGDGISSFLNNLSGYIQTMPIAGP